MTDLPSDLIIIQIDHAVQRKSLLKQKKVIGEHLVRKESTEKMVPVEIFKSFLPSRRVTGVTEAHDICTTNSNRARNTRVVELHERK